MVKKWRYGVILDAGSSGTRLHIYKWKDPAKARKDADDEDLESLPKLVTEKKWTKKIRPGISTFGEHPSDVGREHLKELIDHALDIVPEHKVADTPVFLMATAGMRLLPQVQQAAVLRETCSYLRQTTDFSLPDCDLHIQVIKGETEGLYGWIALNYLLGGFDHPDEHKHGKGHHTYGFLDMGGASAQIAFAPNKTEAAKHWNDLKLLRLRTLDGTPREYQVFTATWLGFGVNQARQNYIDSLEKASEKTKNKEMPDPCMPRGLRTTYDGKVVESASPDSPTLIGTGKFKECMKATYPLLGKDVPCPDEPCLLNGQHVPAIDFDINHFLGVSEYWHTTHGVFGGKDQAYDLTTYQERVTDFCSQDWDDIAPELESSKKKAKASDLKEAQEACFKASWLLNVLYEGIGVPRLGIDKTPPAGLNASKGALEDAKDKGFLDPFQPIDKIEGIEVSWTLGKMVLYAAGQVPPESGDDRDPVGFGSNTKNIPSDFQYAGSSWKPIEQDLDDDDDWPDSADDFLDRAKSKKTSGFFFFLILVIILFFWLRKRERRTRLYTKLSGLFHRSRRSGSPKKGGRGFSKLFRRSSQSYERVLEEGDAGQFELADADSSSDNDNSDSSTGSRFGRSSGLATPQVNVDVFDSSSAIDRAGLVVRTESRDRLVPVPSLSMLNAGRRSRASSPTRLKSPILPPRDN
jgi:golgi apyrase